jgi:hypothetical protein
MKLILNVLVLAMILLILSITSAIPITLDNVAALDPRQAFSPDGPHPHLEGSGLSVAGSGKRGLIALDELHGHHRVAVDGPEKRDATLDHRSPNLDNHKCPIEWLLPNGHCIPKIVTRDAVGNSVKLVGQIFPSK